MKDVAVARKGLAFFLATVAAGRELDGDEPVAEDAVILHYVANGCTAIVTWGDLLALASEDGDGGSVRDRHAPDSAHPGPGGPLW